VRAEHLKAIKDGCVLANAGHFNVEVSPETLARSATSVKRARAGVDVYRLPGGRKVYLLTDGRLVNLAAGQGHPVEIMDMSFAIQYLCAVRLWQSRGTMRPGVHAVPAELDLEVARSKLESLGASIDSLTAAQRHYITSWNEGT
jgi:adenosylhomocysteinase